MKPTNPRRRALHKSIGSDGPTSPALSEVATPEDDAGVNLDEVAWTRQELAKAVHDREAMNGQARAAMYRTVERLREKLDTLTAVESQTRGLTAVGILDLVRELAQGLPEPVLAVFANTWALRHRAKWVPVDDVQDPD